MISKFHYYPITMHSAWPLLISFETFIWFYEFIFFLKGESSWPFMIQCFILPSCVMGWWLNYSFEFKNLGISNYLYEKGLKMSMLLFILSEVFFFFSFFWTYFHYYLNPSIQVGMIWPPVDVHMFNYASTPLFNTCTLLISGVTVTLAHFFLFKNNKNKFNLFMLLTVILGCLFTFLQYSEYSNSYFCMSDCVFGSAFYLLTGFHGIHVIIGTLYLLYTTIWTSNFSSSSLNSMSVELSSWYWHFVDVVWIFLYIFIYVISNN